MSAIDPNIEANPTVPGAEQERLMLRHDLRGALQGVTDGIHRLEAADLAVELREQVDRVAQSAISLSALLDRLLGDEEETDRPLVEIDRFLDALRHRHAGAARERGLLLTVRAAGGLPDGLRLDPISLARVLDNLVIHVMRAAPSGAVRVTASRGAGGTMLFSVGDETFDLTPDTVEHAFATHAGGPGRDRRAGESLGLHIAHALTERMGGGLAFPSNDGAEVLLRFPASVAVDRVVAAPDIPRPGPDLGGARILLAEDNLTNQIVASQMLRALNAEVTICADGVEALERFEAVDPDLVVVDIEMPRLSGLDVIRAIRARDDARAQVPIVALTAYAMREHRERIAAAGADGLISKPITSIEALGRGLAAHIARRPAILPSEGVRDAGEEAGPVIDMPTFDALCSAIGPEMMAELLDKVISDLLSAQTQMSAALPEVDRTVIRSTSHILISVAGALGAVRLQACARSLNGAAHTDSVETIAGGVRRCIREIDAAVAFARQRRAAGGSRP